MGGLQAGTLAQSHRAFHDLQAWEIAASEKEHVVVRSEFVELRSYTAGCELLLLQAHSELFDDSLNHPIDHTVPPTRILVLWVSEDSVRDRMWIGDRTYLDAG